MKFNNFENAALIGAVVAGSVAGEQPKADKPDSTIEKSPTEQVVLAHHQKREKQMDADGREFLMIDGSKFYLSPEPVVFKKAEMPIFKSESYTTVDQEKEGDDKDARIAGSE